jgi:hypothetical protein
MVVFRIASVFMRAERAREPVAMWKTTPPMCCTLGAPRTCPRFTRCVTTDPANSGASRALKAQRSRALCAVCSTPHCQHEPRAGGSDAKHSKPPAFRRHSTNLCSQCFSPPSIPRQTVALRRCTSTPDMQEPRSPRALPIRSTPKPRPARSSAPNN